MSWEPLSLSQSCPAHTQASACSHFGYVYLNLLVQLFSDSEDRRIQNKIHYQDHSEKIVENLHHYQEREEYDFIVVGAGAAGCVVANRLSAVEHWKVLLLEAGMEQPDVTLVPGLSTALLGSSIDWQYFTETNGRSCLARSGKRCAMPRGKTMGGTSSINGMTYMRGNKHDFDGWAASGNIGWSYEEVLPFFKKSEHNMNLEALKREYHGVDGELYVSRYPYIDDPSIIFTEAFIEKGLPLVDFNGHQQTGTMQAQAFSKDGLRVSTNTAFIQPIRYKRKNLVVRPNSEVMKVLIDDHKRAYGVTYFRDGKLHTAVAKKEVIVSGGAINSPKLLMLSGIGPKEHLEHLHIPVVQDLAVGENLHDQPSFNGYVLALPNKTATTVSQREIYDSVKEYRFADPHSPLSGNGPVSTVSFIKSDHGLSAPDIQIQMSPVNWKEFIREPTTVVDALTIFPTSYYNGVIPRCKNVVPKSRGRLLLNSTNPHDAPLINVNYFGDSRDFVPIINCARYVLSLEHTEALKSRGVHFVREPLEACKHYKWGSDEYTLCLAQGYTSPTHHFVGTSKMGPETDKKAVVDPRLRVYGIDRLRVIDASIMPVVIRGNTEAASIMIGEKGSAMILEDWH